jgi:transposase
MVEEKNDIYLEEIQNKIEEKTGIKVSVSSLCRTLQKLQLRRKKKP